jgi:hypothetical protein
MAEYIETLCVVAKEWGEVREPSLNHTFVVYTCVACGGLVRDKAYHDGWHAAQDELLDAMNADLDRALNGRDYE